jgi:ADP-ribosylglycohydrolase
LPFRTDERLVRGVRLLSLVGLLSVFAAGCGGGGSSSVAQLYNAGVVADCLHSDGATVLQINPAQIVGDHSGGAFRVGVGAKYADVAFAATQSKATMTAKLARSMLEKRGSGGAVRHSGNVAYWALSRSSDALNAIRRCLR